MHVPVPLGAKRQGGVGLGEEPAGEVGEELGVAEVVEEEEGQDFVHVVGERVQVEAGCEGLGEPLQEGGAGEEGVAHGFGGEGGGGLGREVEVEVVV